MITAETRAKWGDKTDSIYTCLVNSDIKCSEWEEEFIDSLQMRRSLKRDLTHRQVKVLNRIFERKVI